MSRVGASAHRTTVPDGYEAVPIGVAQTQAPLRICVLVAREPDPSAGPFVALRSALDARVLLGCLTDARGTVHRWLEVWLQDLSALAGAPALMAEALCSAELDRRWARRFADLVALDPGAVIATGWEDVHPLPSLIDTARLEPVHPAHAESGTPWRLCEDDGVLTQGGLPAYGSSLHRYLHAPEAQPAAGFVPVTPEAPVNANTRPVSEVLPDGAALLPLDLAGGLVTVREHCPIRFEPFVDVLGGGTWDGVRHGRATLDLTGLAGELRGDGGSPHQGRLFLERGGRPGRLVEVLHLKIRLLRDAFRAVRDAVRQQQRPVLDLSADSFGVRLASVDSALPLLWTGTAVLCDPGSTVALDVGAADVEYYARAGPQHASVYRPASAAPPVSGTGSLRIRQVLGVADDATIVEATLATQERVTASASDLIWVRLALACGPVDLYARRSEQPGLAVGETRLRTVAQRLHQEAAAALGATQGVPVEGVSFQVLPFLSTPCDLYALGVLAVRALLVDAERALPVVLDDVLSLAGVVAQEYDEAHETGSRVRAVFEREQKWQQALGPHHLLHDALSAEEASQAVPCGLWCDVLGAVLRTFPGVGPDSECRDLGDAPRGAIHQVFESSLADLERLLLRTRDLIVTDWPFNREVRHVVGQALKGLSAAGQPAPTASPDAAGGRGSA
jgi:hypothetical protein